MQALTVAEHERFEECKRIVREGINTVMEVGAALVEIRDRKLHRMHFKTFAEFCEAEFKIGKSRAYQLINAADVSTALQMSTIVDKNIACSMPVTPEIENEAQAREVAKIPPEKRPEVLAKARAVGLTAASIAQAAAEVFHVEQPKPPEPPKPVIELDCTGFAIPAKCLPLWQRRPEVQKVLTALSNVRTALRAAQEAQDVLWQPVTNKGETWTMLLKSLDQAYATTGVAMPYAVCPTCQGQLADMCIECKGRGMVSEFYYKYQCSSDIRKIRETVCKPKP